MVVTDLWDECLLSWELASWDPCEKWVCAGGRQLLSLAAVLLSGCGTKSIVRPSSTDQLHIVSGHCTLQLKLRWLHVWCEICPWDYSVCTTQPCLAPDPSSPFSLDSSIHISVYIPLHLFSAQCFPSSCFSELTHCTSPLHFNVL